MNDKSTFWITFTLLFLKVKFAGRLELDFGPLVYLALEVSCRSVLFHNLIQVKGIFFLTSFWNRL